MAYNTKGSSYARKRRRKNNNTLEKVIRFGLVVIMILVLILAIVLLTKCGKDDDDKSNRVISTSEQNTSNENTSENPSESSSDENEPSSEDVSSTEDESSSETSSETTTGEDETEFPYGDEVFSDGQMIVCIDAGHGGVDGGCVGPDEVRLEKTDALNLSLALKQELEALGVTVIMTRTTDVFIEKYDRTGKANDTNCDVIISLHRNSYTADSSVKGIEAWIHSSNPSNSYNLSALILSDLESVGITRNRGVRCGTQGNAASDYAINSSSLMPSLILEMGFITSPEDNSSYDSKMTSYANSIANSIYDWLSTQNY